MGVVPAKGLLDFLDSLGKDEEEEGTSRQVSAAVNAKEEEKEWCLLRHCKCIK